MATPARNKGETNMEDTGKTFTEDEVRRAVLMYDEGCNDGKVRFLSDAFGIGARCERRVRMTVTITLPKYNTLGEEIDRDKIPSAVGRTLDNWLYGQLDNIDDMLVDAAASDIEEAWCDQKVRMTITLPKYNTLGEEIDRDKIPLAVERTLDNWLYEQLDNIDDMLVNADVSEIEEA